MHALMLLTMGLQTGWMNSISLIPAMVLVLIFKITLSKKFDETFTWSVFYSPLIRLSTDAECVGTFRRIKK